jgi:P27 family predicted phage terminase small subunit
MGRRGPKPKPKTLRLLEGNPGRLAIMPDDADITPNMPPVKPAAVSMDELASLEWDRLVACMPPELYSAADTAVMSTYALAWSMLVKSQAEIDNHGVVVTERVEKFNEDGSGMIRERHRKNPAIDTWKTAAEQIHRCADKLGLSPGVRARLPNPKAQREAPASKFAGLLGKR